MSKSPFFALTALLTGCLDEMPLDETPDDLSSIEQDVSAPGGDDIVILGSTAAGAGIVTAFANTAFGFDVINSLDWFADIAKTPGVQRLKGDFNKDGRMDLALVGGAGWTSIPTAMSNGNGTWQVTNHFVGSDFNNWVRTANVKALVGDYNKDGYSDIALTGAAGWSSIPVAFAAGSGTYQITNHPSGLASYASMGGAQPIVGDYNKDGYSDIAVIGMNGFPFIPVSFAAGGGTWQLTVGFAGSFNAWASTANVKALPGDYNKDGYGDIALTGAVGWASVPVAFAAGGGSWQITNQPVPNFPAKASVANVTPLVGDYNADGFTDIALVGGVNTGWQTIPVAFGAGGGSFQVTDQWAGYNDVQAFASHARVPGAKPIAGDFNGDGSTDIALTGPAWGSIPMVISVGSGWWWAHNQPTSFAPSLTGEAGVSLLVGRVD